MKRSLFITIAALFSAMPAFAQEVAHEATAAAAGIGNSGLFAIGAGVALGVAALGGALAQGKIGAAAMDGIARNPQAQSNIFTPMIIALVFVETLVLFTFVLALLIQGRIV